MSTQFTTYDIETLSQWNAVLAAGLCCEMPSCPLPEKECESLTISKSSWLEYTEAEQAYQTWTDAQQAHDDWVALKDAHDAWLLDPQGDEPPLPEGDMPAAPEGEAPPLPDEIKGEWAQFTEPDGASEDDLPVIYRRLTNGFKFDPEDEQPLYTGSFRDFTALDQTLTIDGSPPTYVTWMSEATYFCHTYSGTRATEGVVHDDVVLDGTYYTLAGVPLDPPEVQTDASPIQHVVPGDSDYSPPGFTGYTVTIPEAYDRTQSKLTLTGLTETATYSSAPSSKPTGDGPWGSNTPGNQTRVSGAEGDLSRKLADTIRELTETLNRSELNSEVLNDDRPWPAIPEGSASESHYSDDWPTIGEITPVGGWPAADFSELPIVASASASATRVRYRWVMPVIGTVNDPAAELPDPLPEGVTEDEWWADHQVDQRFQGTYFKITWDVLTEPDGWDDEIDDPDYVPPIPNDPPEPIPQVPRPGRPSRSYVQDLTWTWAGPGTQVPNPILNEANEVTNQAAIDSAMDTWVSPWFILEVPGEPGIKKVVNVRYECYRGPYGNRPQRSGTPVDLTEDTPLQKRFITDRHSINISTL